MAIDIQDIINNKVTEMLNEGVITQKIEETIEKSIAKCIEESITSWHVTDLIKDKMKKEISEHLEQITFAGYTQQVVDRVLALVEHEKETDISDKVRHTYRKMFIPNKDEYTIDKIVDAFADYMNEHLDYDAKYDLEQYYAKVESSDNNRYYKLILAESQEAAKRRRSSSYEIYYEILFHQTGKNKDEYTVFLIYDNGGNMCQRFERHTYNKFEQMLIGMYLHGNIIREADLEPDYSEEFECYTDIDM